MIKFIFEDNEVTPSSQLLKRCSNGSNLYFVGGNEKILTFLEEQKEVRGAKFENDIYIVFLDVVPNNSLLLDLYATYVIELELRGLYNVTIIPIFCIEYYVLHLLECFNMLSKQKEQQIVNDYNLIKMEAYDKIDFKGKSLEKFLKSIINRCKPFCLRNTSSKKYSYYGEFYKLGCTDCNKTFCDLQLTETVEFLAEWLYI